MKPMTVSHDRNLMTVSNKAHSSIKKLLPNAKTPKYLVFPINWKLLTQVACEFKVLIKLWKEVAWTHQLWREYILKPLIEKYEWQWILHFIRLYTLKKRLLSPIIKNAKFTYLNDARFEYNCFRCQQTSVKETWIVKTLKTWAAALNEKAMIMCQP